jgi:hypothetical protein
MGAYNLRKSAELRALYRAAGAVYDSPTDRAALDTLKSWHPDERIARGSSHTRTRKAHLFCPGGGCEAAGKPGHEDCSTGCGTHSAHHCGGRRFAAITRISFCKDDNTFKIAQGEKRQRRIDERGW